MPGLKCTYGQFIEILQASGFVFCRQNGSHQVWRGVVSGTVCVVVVAGSGKADIPVGTLQSMIRQSGLSKKLFAS